MSYTDRLKWFFEKKERGTDWVSRRNFNSCQIKGRTLLNIIDGNIYTQEVYTFARKQKDVCVTVHLRGEDDAVDIFSSMLASFQVME